MNKVRIGASMAKNVQEVLDWLHVNVGEFKNRRLNNPSRTYYFGDGWMAQWTQYGGGWFMDVVFSHPKHATFFTLRWK